MNVIPIEEKAYEVMKKHFNKCVEDLTQLCEESHINSQWLDNQDVCMLLHVSKRTLQYYRDNRIIPFSRIGNKCYYKVTDIEKLLSDSEIKQK